IDGNISAPGGTAIATFTAAGNSTININSIVEGVGSGVGSVSAGNPVIAATSDTGTTTININVGGVVRSTNGDAKDLAISSPLATTGQIVINNAGTLLGRISLTD